jgi:hypothetical protein
VDKRSKPSNKKDTAKPDDQTPKIILTDADPVVESIVEVDESLTEQESRQEQAVDVRKEIHSLRDSLSKLGKHFIITLSIVGLGVSAHWMIVHVFGDPRFFDLIPVRYVIDAGDIAVIVTFFTIMIRELWKSEE